MIKSERRKLSSTRFVLLVVVAAFFDRRSIVRGHGGGGGGSALPPHLFDLEAITVGSFYVDDFTLEKYNLIADYLVEIASRYHVLALGGLHADADVVPFLLTELNASRDELKGAWQVEVSGKLGGRKGVPDETQQKVVVLYRSDLHMKVLSSYEFKDTEYFDPEADEREADIFPFNPFVVTLSCPHLMGFDAFTIVFAQLTKQDISSEFDALIDVFDEVNEREEAADGNLAIVGPFNIGCGAVTTKELEDFRKTLPEVEWLIADDVNTLVAQDDVCAMDRILISGEGLREALPLNSAGVYRYHETQLLRQSSPAIISKHFPVEFKILLHEEKYAHKDEL